MCSNEKRAAEGKTPCRPAVEIEEFVNDLQTDSWVITDKMDFEVFFRRPTYKASTLNKRQLLRYKDSIIFDIQL